jgi:beta-lactamase superfamily II metal-dependent hydrolase
MKNKFQYIFLAALLAIFIYFSYQIFVEAKSLQIIFLDIGQGDSILIQKGTKQILIDGGPSGKTELAKLGEHLPYFDREIEIVIATHPDKDHIGGLIETARNYKIGKVLTTAAEKDTQAFKEWQETLEYNKIETLEVWRGTEMKFDEVEIKILAPAGKVDPSVGDANDKSVVARLDWGESSFLFTGDIESKAEREILESQENIDVDFLKIAHHGSKYSSSESFLDAASPKDAVISVGAKNSYGHPTEAVLSALKERDISIFRTDEDGDIVYSCENSKCKVQSSK